MLAITGLINSSPMFVRPDFLSKKWALSGLYLNSSPGCLRQ